MAKLVISDLLQIFKYSVSAVYPEVLIKKSMKYNPSSQILTIAGETYDVKNKNVYVVGTGKAVQNMAKEVENMLSTKIKRGIISIPIDSLNHEPSHGIIHYYEGAKNNLPDINAEETAKKVNELVLKLDNNSLLLVLISGGGSALLPLPKEPITLEEKTSLIRKLAFSGADIIELNTVRKKLSGLKGGQLAIKAQPAQVVSLILSDIVGDPIDLIASGPTSENKDDPMKALKIIEKYKLNESVPNSIKTILNESNSLKHFPITNVRNHIIGSNKLSIVAAMDKASHMKYFPIQISNIVTGDIKDVAKTYVQLTRIFCKYLNSTVNWEEFVLQLEALQISGINPDIGNKIKLISNEDVCLIVGGEITVEVKSKGKGGRNQQLALEFCKHLHEVKNYFTDFDIYILSAGTDGIDGPTDAAGAIGYLDLFTDCEKENIDVNKYIENNDSYNFYKEFKNGDLHVITGHTNTNVMDIHLIIIKRNLKL